MEYWDKEFIKYCEDGSIIRHFTTPGGPHKNGGVEKMNMTFFEKTKCMRLQAGLIIYLFIY